ncbi:hypothetical protein M0812_26931 [Anaeramoeba flamelloides]|uniref:Initiator binding domain-containing protein n=1 Tax=Anaeramoeba flamelloides TaxID=1746091 RepID=A0AAV7YBZ3_9EUKA|nr:hypothetical protein M0812_26931 [Anaeramoeba flamelloides]
MSDLPLSTTLSKLPNLALLQMKFGELKNYNSRLAEMKLLFPKSFIGLPTECLKKEWIKSFKKGMISTEEFGEIRILRQSVVDLAYLTGKGQRTIERGMTMFFKRSFNFENINPYSKEWFVFGPSQKKKNPKRKKNFFHLKPKIFVKKQKRDKIKQKRSKTKINTKTKTKAKKDRKTKAQGLKTHSESNNNLKLVLDDQIFNKINQEFGQEELNNKINLDKSIFSSANNTKQTETQTQTQTETQTQTNKNDQVIRKRVYDLKNTESDQLKKRKLLTENKHNDLQKEEPISFDPIFENSFKSLFGKIVDESVFSYSEVNPKVSAKSLIIENKQENYLITEFTNFVPLQQNWLVDTSFFDQIYEFTNYDYGQPQNFVCESWFN